MSEGFKVTVKSAPGPRMIDLQCECGEIREVLVDSRDEKVEDEDQACTACGSTNFEKRIGAPHPTTCHDPGVKDATLRKRSLDHSAKYMKKNWDRLVDQGKLPKT